MASLIQQLANFLNEILNARFYSSVVIKINRSNKSDLLKNQLQKLKTKKTQAIIIIIIFF